MVHFIRLKPIIPYIFLSLYCVKRSLEGVIPTCVATTESAVCTYGTEASAINLGNGNYCKTESNGVLKLYKSNTDDEAEKKCEAITELIIIKESSSKFVDASVSSGESGQIFSCSADGCTQYKSNYHYFVDDSKLYGCDSTGRCTDKTSSISIGNYLSGTPTVTSVSGTTFPSLIGCTGNTIGDCEEKSASVGFYIDASSVTNTIIKCTSSSCQSFNSKAATNEIKYYIDAATDGNLIICTSTSCTSSVASKGYYVDAGNSGKFIQCNGSTCTEAETASSCEKAGPVIAGLKLCTGASTSKLITTKASTPTYEFLTLELTVATDFPGGSAGKITVRIGSEGSIVLLEGGGLINCDAEHETSCFTDASNGQFCVDSTTLYKQSSSACSAVSFTEDVFKFFKNDNKEAKVGTDTISTLYQCKKDGECTLAKGYVINSSNVVQCSGWKDVPCTTTALTSLTVCANEDNGKMGKDKKLCFSKNYSITLPSTGTEYLAFELTKTSEFYGMNEGDVVILNLSSKQAIVTELTGTEQQPKYLLNQNSALNKRLISCDNAGCESIPGNIGYYLDSSKETTTTVDGNDVTVIKSLIKCTNPKTTACESISSPRGYFVDAETAIIDEESGNVTGYTGLISCDENSGCTKLEVSEGGVYLNGAADGVYTKVLIKCTTSEGGSLSCNEEEVSMGNANEIFFMNGNYSSDNEAEGKDLVNYLIKCTSSTQCSLYKSSATEAGNEYFIHGAADGLTESIIECGLVESVEARKKRTTPNNSKTFTALCNILSDVTENAIYINGANNKQIIRCTSSNCVVANTSPTTKKSEYYFGDNLLIQCTTEGCKAFEGEVTNKVFINANYGNGKDTENQLIKCTGSTAEDEGEAQEGQGGQDGQDGQDGLRKRQEEEGQEEEEANQSTECSLSQSSATEKPEFYVNGDETNSEILKGDLIKCIKGENNIINCSEMDGNLNNVYLNANYDAESNDLPIIICKKKEENSDDTGGCIEMSVENDDEESNDNSEDTNKYYVNSGSVNHNLSDTLILCNSSENTCSLLEDDEDIPKASDIYINAVNNQLIYCSEEKGCEAMQTQANKDNNEFYLNASDSEKDLVNDLIKCEVIEDEKICKAINGVEGKVYIDNYTKGNIIYCTTDDGCQSESSFSDEDKSNEGLPKFYVNGDDIDFEDDEDKDPLNGDLIKCTKTGTDKDTKITCIVTKGDKDNVYLNSNYGHGDSTNQLIICTESEGCLPTTCSSSSNQETANLDKRQENEDAEVEEEESSEKFPKFYINSGNPNKLVKGIIKCTSTEEACTLHTAKSFEVYKNGNDNETTKPIIKCGNNNCKTSESSASENNNEYFKNAGNDGETPLEYDIIECSKIGESDASCVEVENANEGVYLNSYYMENGDKEQLIQCSSDNGCVGLRTESKDGQYFVNAEAQTITNAVIFCINKKCEKQTPNSIPSFYVGYMKDEVDGLIKCTDKETTCEFKAAFTSQGYYINDGYNKAQNQTILCDSSDGCAALKVDLGYYINEGEPTKPIIKCEKEGSECIADVSPSCPEIEAAKPGNYCYDDGQLKFFPENNSTYVSASKSEDVYTFATIPDNGFPGIKRETGSLFKISRYFINRFYKSGVVMIDKNGKLVDSLSSDQSDITLYDCNDSTKICTKKPGCTSNTYMYDTENAKAIFCNNGKLEYAEFNGYVVDSNRAVGTNHPYIINCENGKCKSVRPKNTSYYENNGYDSTTNALILCSNNNCYTVTAEVGYYVGHNGSGIIQCTSTTSCNYNDVKSKVKYVNSGANKSSHAIIGCDKSGCSATKAKIGYYMTYSSNLLIQCTSPGSCVEFTPTVNYYDNADSSEGSNTIINCVQSSQVITCATEQTNNRFYMSSSPNVLIRCKSGSKCKTVVVKNGIFRGALKGLTGGSKRSDEEVELEDEDKMGMSVAMPRDADDAYGIIRCVAGKCSALSPSEVASIPVCEFNNNKCYITLEYAMTKSATTSISAGNICTNVDRSVFYFATDTIVVKPNVISGVTATYVYTTTNSNCLEVNDSYTDMYFTVGSNIYLLDQGSVLQFYETGYYFINTAKNTLVSGNDIDAYNDENVKLYKCNGSSCSITDKPDSLTYYADVNKRILKYNVNSDSYSFAYSKDITCIFANNKCTPNADLKNQEFCITYKGELVLAKQDINNRETGECYKASSITNTIYGYSQYLYNMNIYSAKMVDETGYYIVNLSTNTTVVSKNYKTKNNNLVVYGCQLSSCKEYVPDEDIYYYDARAKTILRYLNGIWTTPSNSGYAYISLDPTNTYIYRFTKKLDEVTINAMANYGYYYTIGGEMYHCNQDEDGGCVPISSTGYYFTNAGEVYRCVHDSEELEPTECTKQACISGQYYYIDDAYYRCESSSTLVPVMSRYCSFSENVIINFPLALTEEYPDKIKQAVEGIEKNNNSTAVIINRGKNYLESVSGIFTNCTYNVEETKSTFDLVCVNNYVAVDKETDEVKICSVEQLGYVECVEDEENPEKCNVSWAFQTVLRPSFLFTLIITLFISFIYQL